jgi:TonB family protein
LNVFLTGYKFARVGGITNCDVELQVVNNTTMDLSDIAALVDVNSGQEDYSGNFTINSLPKGAALGVRADFQTCPELNEVKDWRFSDQRGFEGPYHRATGPAYFTLSYDNWQTAVAKLKAQERVGSTTASHDMQRHPENSGSSSSMVPPKLISSQNLPYPPQSIRMRHEGVCILQITVDQDGSVSDASLVTSSGFRELDSAAIRAARGMRFRPAYKDGRPEEVAIEQTFTFSLHRQAPNL